MNKAMANARTKTPQEPVGRLSSAGIRLRVTDEAGQSVHYGVQLNNTTLEIEALPNLKVEVVGYQEMYEVLKSVLDDANNGSFTTLAGTVRKLVEQALAIAEEK